MQKKRTKFTGIFLNKTMRFRGLTSFNKICFSCFAYTVTIRFNEFMWNKFYVCMAL